MVEGSQLVRFGIDAVGHLSSTHFPRSEFKPAFILHPDGTQEPAHEMFDREVIAYLRDGAAHFPPKAGDDGSSETFYEIASDWRLAD